jgi:hypothetical protein
MRHRPPSTHEQEADYIYLASVCVCVVPFSVVPAVGIFSLQRRLQPADSLLFAPTVDGESMILIPTIMLGALAAFWIAWPLTKWIRRTFGLPDKDPIVVADWAKSAWKEINWRFVGGIAGVVLIPIVTQGFRSYFYATESGISVRPPLEFSMRHYEWRDVTTVRVRCIHSPMVKSKRGLRYILKMSDGYEVDLSPALRAMTQTARAAYAARFAEIIPSHLNTVASIVYAFEVSRDGLALLSEKHGTVLPNAIREQVLAHGGTLQ